MIYICLYQPTGEMVMRVTVPDLATAQRLAADRSLPFIALSGTQCSGYVKGGELIPFPEKPTATAVWSWDTHEWIDP